MRSLHLLGVTKLFVFALATPATVAAQTVVPVAPFGSVELHGGGEVILRHGPTRSVTLLKGSLDYTRITIADAGRLVIDKCKSRCPRGYELEIEIVTPNIAGISVADGGTIQSRGSFPRHAEIEATVRDGGTIDIRSIRGDSVTSSVEEGGSIFTKPQTALFASVVNGGEINYWGDARVESSVRGGGAVTKRTAADKPLSELSPPLPSMLPTPPTPSLPPIRPLRRFSLHHHLRRELQQRSWVNVQQNLIPRYILSAVQERGDEASARDRMGLHCTIWRLYGREPSLPNVRPSSVRYLEERTSTYEG